MPRTASVADLVQVSLLACLSLVAVTPAHAQQVVNLHPLFIGGGVGVGGVAAPGDPDGVALDITAHARAGVRISSAVRLMFEYEIHRLNDESPRPSDVLPDLSVPDPAKVLRTQYLLLGVQVHPADGPLFLRPALGIGGNRFASYVDCSVPNCRVSVDTSTEGGLALGAAVGFARALSRSVGLSLEAVVRRSPGEDSTERRTNVGVQGVLIFGF